MKIVDTIAVAFAMYSRIPTKKTEWNSENMKYAMCAFPFIGAVIGALLFAFKFACYKLGFGAPILAAGMTFIPILVTGGIHFDGFCDTADALSSNGDIPRKLEILKDSNSGAFAIISAAAYFFIYYSVSMEMQFNTGVIMCLPLGFMLSRELSGLAVSSFKCAKNSGLLHAFASTAHKKRVKIVLVIMIVLTCFALIFIAPVYGVFMIFASAVCYFLYYRMAYKKFGGTTGDLAGYFLQMCEITMLISILIAQKII